MHLCRWWYRHLGKARFWPWAENWRTAFASAWTEDSICRRMWGIWKICERWMHWERPLDVWRRCLKWNRRWWSVICIQDIIQPWSRKNRDCRWSKCSTIMRIFYPAWPRMTVRKQLSEFPLTEPVMAWTAPSGAAKSFWQIIRHFSGLDVLHHSFRSVVMHPPGKDGELLFPCCTGRWKTVQQPWQWLRNWICAVYRTPKFRWPWRTGRLMRWCPPVPADYSTVSVPFWESGRLQHLKARHPWHWNLQRKRMRKNIKTRLIFSMRWMRCGSKFR